jgi:hypothetical protein
MRTYKYSTKERLLYISLSLFFSFLLVLNIFLNPGEFPVWGRIFLGTLTAICIFQSYISFISLIITDAKIYKQIPFAGIKEIWLNEIYDCETSKIAGNLLLKNAYGQTILSVDKQVQHYEEIYDYIKRLTIFNKQSEKFKIYTYQISQSLIIMGMFFTLLGAFFYLINALVWYGVLLIILITLIRKWIFLKSPFKIILEADSIKLKYRNRVKIIPTSEFREITEIHNKSGTHYTLRLKNGRFIPLDGFIPELKYELQNRINSPVIQTERDKKLKKREKAENIFTRIIEGILDSISHI